MARRGPMVLIASVGAIALYLLAWPVPIDPIAWQAPADPGPSSPTAPEGLQRIVLPDGQGPEDLELDALGRVWTGLEDGRILRWASLAEPGTPQVVADTGGRPLGLHPDGSGGIYIADADQGLLRLRADGRLETLTTTCGGTTLVFADDVETDASGRIWFTEASSRFDFHHYKLDLLESRASGRLCRYDPSTGETVEVASGLHFPNGVAIDPQQRFVLVNETSRYRVLRIDMDDGDITVVRDALPGFPDGISTGEDGRYWLTLASPRNPLVDLAAPHPWAREVMVRLPEILQPAPERVLHLLAIDGDGALRHELYDPKGEAFALITSVQERDGKLLLGSLSEPAWAWLPLP